MYEMEIDLYSVSHGYGFCVAKGLRVFFRIEDFHRESSEEPLPICGEPVSIDRVIGGEKSPRAASVQRLVRPQQHTGRVKSFDTHKGWGFIESGDTVYFLHRSDLTVPFVPIIGSRVTFYAGIRRDKPRACYVSPPGKVENSWRT